ncbi:GSCOCG00011419001-RA-CDS [Cotesia congregata]|uniref:Uncharacterized protein n=1 Tax=Cotesia congregata TaxID=51543 RepID=A0A8J2HAP7_COTCN|nr:GSCOCG00011419001-RA-CDS [Cotesia congregata]CAG5090351.1 Protein of unknown function [Cotesia congregata]
MHESLTFCFEIGAKYAYFRPRYKENTMISINPNIDINKYAKLKTSIKNFSKGHVSKKSKVLSWSQFKKFITEAPDYIYLATKVIAIFGVSGAMRGQEICDLAVQDVEDTGTQMIATVLKTKINIPGRL